MDKILNIEKFTNKLLTMNNGKTIPVIGFGTYQNKDKIDEAIKSAYEAGYRHIDSAVLYENEKKIGQTIAKYKIPRDKIFLTTKILSKDMSYDNTLKQVDNSLKYFGTNYIDLVLIHWPGKKKDRLEVWKALEKTVNDKKVISIGVSNFLIPHLKSILEICKIKPVINQIELHPLFHDKDTIDFCLKENILIEAYSPFAQMNSKMKDNELINNIATCHNVTINQVLVRWNLQNGYICLPKSETKSRIYNNFDIDNFQLSEEEMKNMNSLHCDYKVCWNPIKIKD